MRISRLARTTALAIGAAAASIVPFIASATAGDRYRGQHGRHPGYYKPVPQHRYVQPRHHDYGHRHRNGPDGRAIALGVGALILGTIIASEAARAGRHHHHYDD